MRHFVSLTVATLLVLSLCIGVQAYQRRVLLEDYTSST